MTLQHDVENSRALHSFSVGQHLISISIKVAIAQNRQLSLQLMYMEAQLHIRC